MDDGLLTPVRKRGWRLFTVDSRKAPRAIVSQEWLDMMAVRCGPNPEKHPLYQTDVMGIHPTTTELSVYSMALLEACAELRPRVGDLRMGVDLSSASGKDTCFATVRDKGRVVGVKQWNTMVGPKADLVKSCKIIRGLAEGWRVPPHLVNIDKGGLGIGVYDMLHSQGFGCVGVDFGGSVQGDWRDILGSGPKLKNRKQELAWVLWRLLQENLFSIPRDAKYAPIWADLVAMQKKKHLTAGEEWSVEENAVFKERTGRSADAFASLIISLAKDDALRVAVYAEGHGRW